MPAPGPTLRLAIRCRLRDHRGDRKLAELAEVTGIHRGTLSQLERGERLPRPAHVEQLELAYGPRDTWYSVEIASEVVP